MAVDGKFAHDETHPASTPVGREWTRLCLGGSQLWSIDHAIHRAGRSYALTALGWPPIIPPPSISLFSHWQAVVAMPWMLRVDWWIGRRPIAAFAAMLFVASAMVAAPAVAAAPTRAKKQPARHARLSNADDDVHMSASEPALLSADAGDADRNSAGANAAGASDVNDAITDVAPAPTNGPRGKEQLRAPSINGRMRWISPYEIGDDTTDDDDFCFDWRRPTGVFPWLPRTPDRYRFWGPGEPLWDSSWLNRPLHFDAFLGVAFGDKITSHVHQRDTAFGGYRLGWDYDHYWGAEARIVGSHFELVDASTITNGDYSDLVYGDLNLLYYPWGDARWRPYVSLGMGLTYAHLIDDLNRSINNTMFSMPFGMGVKYRVKDTITWRFDVTDNLSFGSGPVRTMNNVSLTGGVELHFGGRRRSYWPWNPSRHLWHN